LNSKGRLFWLIDTINQAQQILDRAGPAAFYWMTEIAAQRSILFAPQINGIPANVNAELGESATLDGSW
jgi:hypothetical protein